MILSQILVNLRAQLAMCQVQYLVLCDSLVIRIYAVVELYY